MLDLTEWKLMENYDLIKVIESFSNILGEFSKAFG